MKKEHRRVVSLVFILVLSQLVPREALAQGGQILFGDVRVTAENNEVVPKEVTLILRHATQGEVGRQIVSTRGRYRFTNVKNLSDCELIVEVVGKEIARVGELTIGSLNTPYGIRYDLEFRWKPGSGAPQPTAGVISAADVYDRPATTKPLFQKAEEAVAKRKFDQATALLKQVVETDKVDFQAWNALGTVYFAQENFEEAEHAYLQAVQVRPESARAQLNLGRLRSTQKRFEEAIEPLTKAVELQPDSGDANLLMGECYLQVKKGSKAIPYLNEAARLGRPEAHLRLGWLYNAAGMKDKAALEYEEFLKKKPDYPDRNKLKEYITANKKS